MLNTILNLNRGGSTICYICQLTYKYITNYFIVGFYHFTLYLRKEAITRNHSYMVPYRKVWYQKIINLQFTQ